jgi:hypothetical protein
MCVQKDNQGIVRMEMPGNDADCMFVDSYLQSEENLKFSETKGEEILVEVK